MMCGLYYYYPTMLVEAISINESIITPKLFKKYSLISQNVLTNIKIEIEVKRFRFKVFSLLSLEEFKKELLKKSVFHIDINNIIILSKISPVKIEHQTDFYFKYGDIKHKMFIGIRIDIDDPILNGLYIGFGLWDYFKLDCFKKDCNNDLSMSMNFKFKYKNDFKTEIGKFLYDIEFVEIIPFCQKSQFIIKEDIQKLMMKLEYNNKFDYFSFRTMLKAETFFQKIEVEKGITIAQKGIEELSIFVPHINIKSAKVIIMPEKKISGILFEIEGGFPIIKNILDLKIIYHIGNIWDTPFKSSNEVFDLNYSITVKFTFPNILNIIKVTLAILTQPINPISIIKYENNFNISLSIENI